MIKPIFFMITSEPFCTIDSPCNDALLWTKTRLSQAGLRVLQTFDLNAARRPAAEVPCPHHGMENCDCQLVVLLVYEPFDSTSGRSPVPEPTTLILHGTDGKTSLSLIHDSLHPANPAIHLDIERIFQVK